ncbi:hypothetical protein ACFLYL_02435 [Chloroflexota bacterium]
MRASIAVKVTGFTILCLMAFGLSCDNHNIPVDSIDGTEGRTSAVNPEHAGAPINPTGKPVRSTVAKDNQSPLPAAKSNLYFPVRYCDPSDPRTDAYSTDCLTLSGNRNTLFTFPSCQRPDEAIAIDSGNNLYFTVGYCDPSDPSEIYRYSIDRLTPSGERSTLLTFPPCQLPDEALTIQ